MGRMSLCLISKDSMGQIDFTLSRLINGWCLGNQVDQLTDLTLELKKLIKIRRDPNEMKITNQKST